MTKPVRVGVIGLGQRGLQHVRSLWQLQGQGHAQIVALGDAFEANIQVDKLQQYVEGFRPDGVLLTTSFAQVLESDLDALYVCIPPNLHDGQVVEAARAGVNLFVEKPVSLYIDEALEMQAAIEQAGVISTVGFQQRFDVRNETVRDFLDGKQVVQANYTLHAPLEAHSVKHMQTETAGGPRNRVWTASRAWSGGTVVEGGIHPLDLWRYWFGDVAWVQAVYVHRPPHEIVDGADNPYAYTAIFGFECGAIGNLTLSRLRRVYHSDFAHRILWNEGHLLLEPQEIVSYHYDGAYPPAQRPADSDVRRALAVPPANNSTFEISANFVQAVAENRPELIRSPFGPAMNSLTAVMAANISDELNGARVDLNALLTSDEYARFRRKEA